MVIDDLDVKGTAVFPTETYPPLIVDPDAPLACTIAGKLFQPIARRNAKEVKGGGTVQLLQFALCNTLNFLRQLG
jgi:hypothetical protein